jgi:cytochrome c-type biogenesis protein CcmH
MTPLILIYVAALVAVAFFLGPLLRLTTRDRLQNARDEIARLAAALSAGTIDASDYAARRTAIGEALLDHVESPPLKAMPRILAALIVAVLLPAAAGIYAWRMTRPESPAHASMNSPAAPLTDHGVDMQAAIKKLADKLRDHPDDAQGWALLGRTYRALERYPDAKDAFRRALEAAPGDADLANEYANAETPIEPEHTDFEPQQSPVPHTSFAEMMVASKNLNSPAASKQAAPSPKILLKVALDPKLKDQVAPSDTLFVFAKAANGPKMPLAIQRLTAGQLPTQVTLTDAMAMTPENTLSRFPEVILGARISKSGNASPQRGDLQAVSEPVSNQRVDAIKLVIATEVD